MWDISDRMLTSVQRTGVSLPDCTLTRMQHQSQNAPGSFCSCAAAYRSPESHGHPEYIGVVLRIEKGLGISKAAGILHTLLE